MAAENLTFRPLLSNDWPTVVSWFQSEGWGTKNDYLFKFKMASKMRHYRFVVAAGKENVPLSYLGYAIFDTYIFINEFMTDQRCRGLGIGLKLWNWVIDTNGKNKIYHLMSVEPMTEKYRTISGFAYVSPITCLRYVGNINKEKLGQLSKEKKRRSSNGLKVFSNLDKETIENVIQYDFAIRNRKANDFFEIWLEPNLHNTVYNICCKDEHGHLTGYGSVAMVDTCRRLGPLVADNFSIMLILLENLIKYDFLQENIQYCQNLEWSVPSSNHLVIEFIEKLEFTLDIVLNRSFTEKVDFDYYSEKICCLSSQIGAPN